MTGVPIWDRGGWLGFPRLTDRLEADVCVVGLGGSGVRAADEAVRRGMTVVGIDAGTIAGGASGRNGGFLLAGMSVFYDEAVAEFGRDKARRFYQQTLDELDDLFAEDHARRVGSLRIAGGEEELANIESEYDALLDDDFSVEWYEGPEGTGILVPSNGVCDPLARVRDLACAAADRGAALYEHSRAIAIEDGAVTTELGRVEAESIIVAVDGGLERLLPELADRVRTASLQMLATEPIGESIFGRPVYRDLGFTYFRQLPGGELALGGGRERYLERSFEAGAGVIPEVQEHLDRILASLGVTAPVARRWAGHAAFTETPRPVMQEVRRGVVAIGAYSGHGNVVGSIYARSAIEQLAEGRPIEAPL